MSGADSLGRWRLGVFRLGKLNVVRKRRIQYSLRFLLLLMLVSAIAVFLWGRPEPSAISGTVTVDGTPLASGTIVLHSTAGTTKITATITNGQFDMALPIGMYSVGVQSNTLKTKRYSSPQSSGMVISVQEGKNVFAFDLTQQVAPAVR